MGFLENATNLKGMHSASGASASIFPSGKLPPRPRRTLSLLLAGSENDSASPPKLLISDSIC
ncbi:hypothetical protein A6U85_00270 [Agrobacterium sp. 13-626]|nr:hypothetical protein A6U85_00270 [Agrobacterium sp. 13-626]